MTRNSGFLFGYTNIIVNGVIILITILNFLVYKFRQLQHEEFVERTNRLMTLSIRQLCYHFTLDEMKKATSNFHDDLVIGKGGFGNVYKGTFAVGDTPTLVAIKRLKSMSNQGSVEFRAEIEMLSKFRHSHLVSLIGYCDEGCEMILVYELLPGGTLADHLYKRVRDGDTSLTPLSWVQRLKICIGAARGLDYLHTGTGIQHRIIHRDIKSTNILLDENFAAKISDFGLSKLSPANQGDTFVSTHVKGTFGYFDPYYFLTRRLTKKSDVYAFGVVLFEVLCGRPAVDTGLDEEQMGLAGWAQHCFRDGLLGNIIDPGIKGNVFPDSLETFVKVAIQCLHLGPKHRPTMAEVVVGLEAALALQEKSTEYHLPEIITVNREANSARNSDRALSVVLQSSNLKSYTFHDLSIATRNFHPDGVLGRGGTQIVFKGWVDENTFAAAKWGTGLVIAVKRLRFNESTQGYKDWLREINILGKLCHPNIVKLIGYCLEKKHRLLVLEYIPRGSLDMHLFRRDSDYQPLSWKLRISIALGAAKGLAYLHSPEVNVIHRDLKTSNILIDSEYNAKLSDFGYNEDGPEYVSTLGLETLGYLAPEYLESGHLTMESDVYGFGVILLEILIGQNAFESKLENQFCESKSMFSWAEYHLSKEHGIWDMTDADIKGQYSVGAASRAYSLVIRCISPFPKSRPDAKQIVEDLEQLLDLVNLENMHQVNPREND